MQTNISRRRAAARVSGAVVGAVAMLAAGWSLTASANPYASGVQISGTTVNFTLNEAADLLTVSINGGAPQVLDGSTKGLKSFNLTSASDTFTIVAKKLDTVGYTVPTGGTIDSHPSGLSQTTAEAGLRLLSDDTNNLVKFNSPRGVTVGLNPNQANFGTTYVGNSATGTTGGRTLGDGLYALGADQSDVLNKVNAASTGGLTFTNSTNSPYRISAGPDGNVYISDWSDADGGVKRISGNLSTGGLVLATAGGATPLPAGQNHGSTSGAVVTQGPTGLTLYTIDEDLSTAQVTGSGSTEDRGSLWRYDIGNASLPYSGMPTRVNQTLPLVVTTATSTATADLDRGADGKFYVAQSRQAGGEPGLFVLSSNGAVLFNSLTESKALLADPDATDILANIMAVAVSPDQKYLAAMLNNSDVAVLPLVDGLPNLANRFVIDTGTEINSGRDIAFDAADNIHYVSSGQGLYRVLSPGGDQTTTLSYDGSTFTFTNGPVAVPEPASLALLAIGAAAALGRRGRRR